MVTTTVGNYSVEKYPTAVTITYDDVAGVVTFLPNNDPSFAFSLPVAVAEDMLDDLTAALLTS